MSKLIRKRSRQFSAFTLLLGAVVLLSFAFVERSRSANPAAGTLNPVSGTFVSWAGAASLGAPSADESTCVEQPGIAQNCDTYTLTLGAGDWSGKTARITISWSPGLSGLNDFDVFVHKGGPTGPLVASSAQGGSGPEVVEIDPNNPSVGTGIFAVRVVYFTAETGDGYSGKAEVVGGPTPTPTPPGTTPTPTPTPPPTLPYIPRYQNYYPPAGVADDAGEPSIGVNWNTEQTHTNNRASDGAVNAPIANGGTENMYGGFLTYMLRARFNDCSSPADVDWQQKPVTLPATPRGFGDPILFTDHETGRTFVVQLEGLTPAGSTIEFTDNDGESFSPSQGGAPSCIDHQTVGGGPFHSPLPPQLPNPAPYPNAVYYASQCISNATAQLSVDGGITFPIQNAMFTAAQCAGLHGHLKVAPDGTAFVPDKACVPPGSGVPLLTGGEVAVAVSEDNNLTWNIRTVPGERTLGNDDPSVGVSICRPNDPGCDKAARSNTIYLGWQAENGHGKIAVSHDKGVTWTNITDVGALPGGPVINNIAFPAVVVGDPDRAAFAFFGTATAGSDADQPTFAGVWYLYIATTTDGGATWTTINATPGDPIQRGGICGSGTCRNLLDFFDIQVDKEGRIIVGGEDGCIGGCVNGGPNSFTAKAFITRQSGGRRLFANFDPVEPTLPGAPLVSGGASGSTVQLTWPEPDNGAATITQYKIYKNASFTPVATTTQRNYTDTAFAAGDTYRVTAVNSQGEGPYCGNFAPSGAPVASACVLPGILVNNDVTQAGADDDSGQNTPVDPRVNARQLFIAEPFVSAGVENFVFTLFVAPSTMNSAPPNSQWFIVWNRQGTDPNDPNDASFDRMYVAMATDATGSPKFDYGKFGIPINTSPPPPPDPKANTPVKFGNADSGSYNPLTGEIKITIAKSKLRAIDGGNTKYQAMSDLAGTNVRTYFNRPDYQPDNNPPITAQRSQNNASDITADGTYSIVGSAACAPAPQLVSAVSRKTHGTKGPFDIKLFPIVPAGNVGIECRKGDGANSNTHYAIFTFAAPVTFTGASVTGGGSAATTPAPGSPPTSEVIVNFTSSNAQTVTVNLNGVTAGGASSSVSAAVGILLGDVNESRSVSNGDVSLVKARVATPVAEDNFRADVNANGVITNGDVSLTKAKVPSSLP